MAVISTRFVLITAILSWEIIMFKHQLENSVILGKLANTSTGLTQIDHDLSNISVPVSNFH